MLRNASHRIAWLKTNNFANATPCLYNSNRSAWGISYWLVADVVYLQNCICIVCAPSHFSNGYLPDRSTDKRMFGAKLTVFTWNYFVTQNLVSGVLLQWISTDAWMSLQMTLFTCIRLMWTILISYGPQNHHIANDERSTTIDQTKLFRINLIIFF